MIAPGAVYGCFITGICMAGHPKAGISGQHTFQPAGCALLAVGHDHHAAALGEDADALVSVPDGQVVAATGSANGVVAPWEGPKAGVALMDTFAPSVEKNSLYVSTVKKGVAPGFDPMLIISAPIFDAAEPTPIVSTHPNERPRHKPSGRPRRRASPDYRNSCRHRHG